MRIGIVSQSDSDLCTLILSLRGCRATRLTPDEVDSYDLSRFDALCILGGPEQFVLPASARAAVEAQIAAGKPVYCECVSSIGYVYSADPASTRYKRLVCVGGQALAEYGVQNGDVLDDQCGLQNAPYSSERGAVPLLVYQDYVKGHASIDMSAAKAVEVPHYALWLEKPNLLLSSFCLCNLVRARFAPLAKWNGVIRYILTHLKLPVPSNFALPRAYHLRACGEDAEFGARLAETVERAVNWFERAGMIPMNGTRGALEGLGTEIYWDGTQRVSRQVRDDCTGEVGLAYYSHYLMTGDALSLDRSDHLERFCFEHMQIKTGPFAGMLRWTETAWEVNYQDDAARVMIPTLLKALYSGDARMLPACRASLDFLMSTTGPDGLRVWRTDNVHLDAERLAALRTQEGNFVSGHYNGYYLASLLLASKVTGERKYAEVGIRGMTAMMAAYPNTRREISETEEMCRLVLPLAMLYWVTREETHRQWLYRVCGDLQRCRHASGAYLEWDTGYAAALHGTENAESSMLNKNGDPIVDMLYSLNWLPLGFLQSYLVTGDAYFFGLWESIARYFIGTQIHSDNRMIDGGWTRGLDVELMEVYGNPNDIGWGPWAIESGWTVGEIAGGLALGAIAEKLKRFYAE